MSVWVLFAAIAAYGLLLFWIAWSGDRGAGAYGRLPRGMIYALSLAVYCTSWTYFGSVGTAARSGWEYLTIFLGPMLAVTLLFPLWAKVAAASKRVNAGSVADFLAARYGKSRPLGALVAIVAVVGSLPYIALQLRSLSMGWTLLTSGERGGSPGDGTLLVVTILLAGFAILFGARRADLTAHNRGLVEAMGLESIVKLGGLVIAALIAIVFLFNVHAPMAHHLGALAQPPVFDARFFVMTLLSAAAFVCIPRQFHMGFVELNDMEQVEEVHRTLPAYFLLMALSVVPVVAASAIASPASANPDLLILDLPLRVSGGALALIVFLGGFSASTAMVIVEAVALSAMISNELVLPLAVRRRWQAKIREGEFSGAILFVRRATILGILVMAWLYCRQLNPSEGLASIGITAISAAAQFAPALIAAVIWKRGTALGAMAGIATGFAVWLYALLLPQLGWSRTPAWLGQGDPIVVATLWSWGLNTFLLVVVSLLVPARLAERVQADLFLGQTGATAGGGRTAGLAGRVGDLRDLMMRFIGHEAAERSFAAISRELGQPLDDEAAVSPALAREVERRLAGVIGSSSAQGVIAVALSGDSRGPQDVRRLLDEAAQAVQFSRELLQNALDNVEQGISVIDADLRLVAWNERYIDLFGFPSHFIHVGKPVADVLSFNAMQGEWASGDPEGHIARRLRALRRRLPHTYERERPNGSVLRCVGAPMPGGGYVTTFTDITDHKRREDGLAAAAKALEEANQYLERRVEDRTADLRIAIAEAEAANASKTRFLAAASHDLLQPLHAARLFVAALAEEGDGEGEVRRLASQADKSIAAADGLLRALLNLAKLEAGKVKPTVRPVALKTLLDDLHREFLPTAAEKGLDLRVLPTRAWVRSDPHLLRSLLQNLIGNALAYTRTGVVLVGARRDGQSLRIEVWDTGPGIPDEARESIFRDFWRGASAAGTSGMGLGLAIVHRVANLLDHPLELRSLVGQGSMFSVTVPRAVEKKVAEPVVKRTGALGGLRVLCVDDDQAILDSVEALIGRWGGVVDKARSMEEAMALEATWSASLIDYHLGEDRTGVELISNLGLRLGRIALVTAETSDELMASARAAGAAVLNKPLQPAVLRTFLLGAPAVAAE